MTAAEQKAIEAQTAQLLKAKAARGIGVPKGALAAASVPVYINVMRTRPATVTSRTRRSPSRSPTEQDLRRSGVVVGREHRLHLHLAGTTRYNNTNWHKDKQSSTYRKQTRKGGKNALNIWLVDFAYLGIATFPWDYARNPGSTVSACSTARCPVVRSRTTTW